MNKVRNCVAGVGLAGVVGLAGCNFTLDDLDLSGAFDLSGTKLEEPSPELMRGLGAATFAAAGARAESKGDLETSTTLYTIGGMIHDVNVANARRSRQSVTVNVGNQNQQTRPETGQEIRESETQYLFFTFGNVDYNGDLNISEEELARAIERGQRSTFGLGDYITFTGIFDGGRAPYQLRFELVDPEGDTSYISSSTWTQSAPFSWSNLFFNDVYINERGLWRGRYYLDDDFVGESRVLIRRRGRDTGE